MLDASCMNPLSLHAGRYCHGVVQWRPIRVGPNAAGIICKLEHHHEVCHEHPECLKKKAKQRVPRLGSSVDDNHLFLCVSICFELTVDNKPLVTAK